MSATATLWLGIVLSVIGTALLVVASLLLWRWQRVTEQLKSLSEQTGASDERARAALVHADTMVLSIEVLNPLELARANSRIGSSLAGVAPGLVRKRVYQQVARELGDELGERGVKANIEIHRAGQ